jgi:hypothetical protein
MSLMRTLSCRKLPPRVALGVAAFLLGITDAFTAAMAQDLEAGVNTASSQFKRVIKVGATVATLVIIVFGLIFTAFKFSRKDQDAVWYLAGTIAGAALCGIAAGML